MPTFVTPLMLLGTALVAVPILLHLLMWQQPRHLEFPALRFIRQRRETNRRRLRLRHLLLLLLRAGAIALLAVALARPALQAAGLLSGGESPVAAALVFDTSPRMEYRYKNQTRLAAAQKLGRSLLSQLPAQSKVAVFDRQHARSDFDQNSSVAGLRVDQLAAAAAPQPLLAAFDQALSVVRKGEKLRKEVHIFTDLARTEWGGDQTAGWQKRLRENPDVAVYVVDVGVEDPQNFALGEVQISNKVVSQNGSLRIRSELVREGPAGEQAVRLYFTGPDGKLQLKADGTFACQANSATDIEFNIGALPLGTHQGYIEIVATDALPIDNRRYFTARIAPPWRLLVAAPPPAAVRAQAVASLFAPVVLTRQQQAEFECETIDFDALASASLKKYDAIWLLDPPPLADALWRKLSDYATDGGGIAIALGGRAGPTGDRMNTAAPQELLPGKLRLLFNTGGDDLYLAPDRLEHPVFEVLKKMQGAIPWDRNPVFKYWDLDPLDKSAQVLLRYGNGRPALIERRVGRGRVLTLTTSLVPSARQPWNLLLVPQREAWPGITLVWGMGQYLVGRVDEKVNYLIGDVAEIRLGKDEIFDSYLLTTPLGDTIKVNQQEGAIRFDDTKVAGQYQLKAGGETDVRRGFSVNLDPAATRLARIDPAAFHKAFDKTTLQLARSDAELTRERRGGGPGAPVELYPLLVLAVAIFVVGENLLSSMFYRKT